MVEKLKTWGIKRFRIREFVVRESFITAIVYGETEKGYEVYTLEGYREIIYFEDILGAEDIELREDEKSLILEASKMHKYRSKYDGKRLKEIRKQLHVIRDEPVLAINEWFQRAFKDKMGSLLEDRGYSISFKFEYSRTSRNRVLTLKRISEVPGEPTEFKFVKKDIYQGHAIGARYKKEYERVLNESSVSNLGLDRRAYDNMLWGSSSTELKVLRNYHCFKLLNEHKIRFGMKDEKETKEWVYRIVEEIVTEALKSGAVSS